MKNKLNSVFFSCFFIAVLLAELYVTFILKADPITVGGIGIVLLISLYLLLDSLRSQWKQSRDKLIFYLEHLYREEVEKSDVRYTELLNLQKASYASAKKNAARLEEKLEELMERLHLMERSNSEALSRVAELQRKLMDGQKNALNIEVNYQKENTKALIAAIKEEAERLNPEDILEHILQILKDRRELPSQEEQLKAPQLQYEEEYANVWEDQVPVLTDYSEENSKEDLQQEDIVEELQQGNIVEELLQEDSLEELLQENVVEELQQEDIAEELQQEELTESEDMLSTSPEVVPLYDDPNKSLTREEIASLFASYGK